MKNKQYRHRAMPTRLLVFSLFGSNPGISRRVYLDKCVIRIKSAQVRRLLRIPSGRFSEYLGWLATHGYIAELEQGRGYAQFIVRPITDYNISDLLGTQ